jgi:hypothetical protein
MVDQWRMKQALRRRNQPRDQIYHNTAAVYIYPNFVTRTSYNMAVTMSLSHRLLQSCSWVSSRLFALAPECHPPIFTPIHFNGSIGNFCFDVSSADAAHSNIPIRSTYGFGRILNLKSNSPPYFLGILAISTYLSSVSNISPTARKEMALFIILDIFRTSDLEIAGSAIQGGAQTLGISIDHKKHVLRVTAQALHQSLHLGVFNITVIVYSSSSQGAGCCNSGLVVDILLILSGVRAHPLSRRYTT